MYIHKFTNENEANNAIDLINQGEGIPVSADSITTTYTTVQQKDGHIFIFADEVTEKYLGQPIEIELTQELL